MSGTLDFAKTDVNVTFVDEKKNINLNYNHEYYLLNKQTIAKQQKKCLNNLIYGI